MKHKKDIEWHKKKRYKGEIKEEKKIKLVWRENVKKRNRKI